MVELCFATDGLKVIGDREKGVAVDVSYGEMFKIVHEFLNECYRSELIIEAGRVKLIRMKQGDGSPYPILAEGIMDTGKTYTVQLRCDEIVGLKSTV